VRASVTGRDQHHNRLAPAEREPDEQGDAERGDEEMAQQLHRLLVGRLPIVAGDGEPEVAGHQVPAQLIHLLEHPLGQRGGVDAGPLGDGQGDGRLRPCGLARQVGDVPRRLPRPVVHLGNLAQPDASSIRHRHEHLLHVLATLQEAARPELDMTVRVQHRASGQHRIGGFERLKQLDRREPVRGEPGRIGDHLHGARRAADQVDLRHVRNALELTPQLASELMQQVLVVAAAPEGEC
jgi:hypothetical protein